MAKSTTVSSGPFVVVCILAIAHSGCHDGPLYGLKTINPYFTLNTWRKDEAMGATEFTRRRQLTDLARTIGSMPATEQASWTEHLQTILDEDNNPEMRRLAVLAAGNMADPSALSLVQKGLDDDSVKVRMEACRALGTKDSDEAASLLATAIGSETDEDVKHSALAALANHSGPVAIDSLRTALKNRNPATRSLAINSLRGVTGLDHGNDPQTWIAALDDLAEPSPDASSPGGPDDEGEARIAETPSPGGGASEFQLR